MSEYRAYISKITDLKQDILHSLEFIYSKDYVKSNSVVFVKQIIAFHCYKKGTTKCPLILEENLAIFKDRPEQVIFSESVGEKQIFSVVVVFTGHGMSDVSQETLAVEQI